MTQEENLIHVKLDYGEAINSKKDILFTEMDLLRILKVIKNFHTLRSEELALKLKAHKKIKELQITMNKLHTLLPTIKIPKLLQKKEEKQEIQKIIKKTKLKPITKEKPKKYSDEIEKQLEEIQKKLKSLG